MGAGEQPAPPSVALKGWPKPAPEVFLQSLFSFLDGFIETDFLRLNRLSLPRCSFFDFYVASLL